MGSGLSLLMLAAASAGMTLKPFGDLQDIFRTRNPWHGYDASKSPVLLVTRAEHIENTATPEACAAWIKALETYPKGVRLLSRSIGASRAWEPWKNEDLEGVSGCISSPCKVKLNPSEAGQMAAVPPGARREQYLKLVEERMSRYEKSGERKGYEDLGTPVDPWVLLETAGFVTPLVRPEQPNLSARMIEFAPGRFRAVRQVYDRRLATSMQGAKPMRAALWIRDVYNAHYFDSWGEWHSVECAVEGPQRGVTVVQALVIELDLLKKKDWISRMAYSRMREGVRDRGHKYLDEAFAQFKASAKSRPESPSK